jgi:SAM-dependent methyltransferase
MGAVPERMKRAIKVLDVRPDDRILEIGCGSGAAAALIVQQLDGTRGGRLTAIDRSATAITRARKRLSNEGTGHLVELHQVELAELPQDLVCGNRSHGSGAFNKALAVNVNLFWTGRAEAELGMLDRVLVPGAVLHLVYDGPGPGGARSVEVPVVANLKRHGYAVEHIRTPSGLLLITGCRARESRSSPV